LFYVSSPLKGRCHTLPQGIIDMALDIDIIGRKHYVHNVLFDFVHPQENETSVEGLFQLPNFAENRFVERQKVYAAARRQMYTEERKIVGSHNSSIIHILQQQEFLSIKPPSSIAYQKLLRAILALLKAEGQSRIFDQQWTKRLVGYMQENYNDLQGIQVLELARSIRIGKQSAICNQQGRRILEGEEILLAPAAHQALYQEYIVQAIIPKDNGYRLIEYVWHWEKLITYIPDIETRPLLMHQVARLLEKKFSLELNSIGCELWDVENGKIYPV